MTPVNSVSFGNREQKDSGLGVIGAGIGLGAGAAIGGYAKQRYATAQDVLKQPEKDSFQLSKGVQEGATEAEKTAVETINKLKKEHAGIPAKAKEYAEKALKGRETLPVVEEFLGTTVEEFETRFIGETKTTLKNLKEMLPELEEAVEKANGEEAVNSAKQGLKEHKKEINKLTKLVENFESHLNVAKKYPDGIPKNAYKEILEKDLKSVNSSKIEKALKALGEKCPKKFNGKSAAIGAAIGLATMWLGSKIFGGSKEA